MGNRVILADDSVTIQKVVGIIFANEGYDLTVVASGDAAIAKAREIKPDVMLVDALMPGKNGYEVCREIRQDPSLAHTAILLMTGAFEVVDDERNRQSGADDFITKPFESQSLIEVTRKLIALTAERAAKGAPAQAPAAAAPPVQPAAVPPQVAAPVPPPAPIAAPAAVDDIWATGFDDEPAAAPPQSAAPTPPPAPAVPEPVAASAADDIWGAFDMDEIYAAPPQPAPPAAAASADADDIFSFESTAAAVPQAAEADAFLLDEVAFSEPAPAAAATFAPPPVDDEFGAISFEEPAVPVVAPAAAPSASVPAEDDFSTVSFEEPVMPAVAPVMPPAAPSLPAEEDFSTIAFDEPAAPPAAPVVAPPPVMPAVAPPPVEPPVFEPPPVAAPVAAPTAPAPAAPAPAAAAFDEAQVKAMLASLSREMIEKIVWEVVPDLAETIIKEEIRKLKAGIV